MKRVLFFVAVLFIVSLENGFCQNVMQIKIGNYSISVPSGWMAQYTDSTYVFILYSPIEEDDTFQENANLTLEKLPTKYSVKGYLKAAQDALKGVYGDFKLIESGDNYHIITGILNETKLKQIQFVSIKDDIAYILTYTSNPENFERYLNTFKEIQRTFEY